MKKSLDIDQYRLNLGDAPEMGWSRPTRPFIIDRRLPLAIDLETNDPLLFRKGYSHHYGEGHIAGISLAQPGCPGVYLPIGHRDQETNYDKDRVLSYIKKSLQEHESYLVGANLQYDLGWLLSQGIFPGPQVKCWCIQVVAAVIDEDLPGGYSLNNLGKVYGKGEKNRDLLVAAAKYYGVDPKSQMHLLHPGYVGAYAIQDAELTLAIFEEQQPIIIREGLEKICQLECDVTPVLVEMSHQGISISEEACARLASDFRVKKEEILHKLKMSYGLEDIWSSNRIAEICDRLQIKYPFTHKGASSFTKEFLEGSDVPLFHDIRTAREIDRTSKTFLWDYVEKWQYRGRIYPQWIQLHRDDGGTRTGRLAASFPNVQQIPARSELGKMVRSIFIPHHEDLRWAKMDYSQQEPRILVHFCSLSKMRSVRPAVEMYRKDRKGDIYQILSKMCGLSRFDAKTATLGRFYGMGARKFAEKLGVSLEEAQDRLHKFDQNAPFIKELSENVERVARTRGYIRTLGGRLSHFNLWEPPNAWDRRQAGEDTGPFSQEAARDKWGDGIVRAGVRKALNRLIQGSAADMTKRALCSLRHQLGVIPYIQVHDEIGVGVTSEKQASDCIKAMENVYEMEVPIVCDLDLGDTWK